MQQILYSIWNLAGKLNNLDPSGVVLVVQRLLLSGEYFEPPPLNVKKRCKSVPYETHHVRGFTYKLKKKQLENKVNELQLPLSFAMFSCFRENIVLWLHKRISYIYSRYHLGRFHTKKWTPNHSPRKFPAENPF